MPAQDKRKTTLKEAREKDNLDQFIKEHEEDDNGDSDKLDATLRSVLEPTPPQKKRAGKKKPAR